MSEHDELLDTAAAWVLGALPADEAAAFEAALAGDPQLQAEVARLQGAADALALAAPAAEPPASLKANVMAIVEGEAELMAAAGPAADRPPTRRRWFARPWLTATAVTAALAIGIGIGIAVSGGGPETVAHPVTGVQRWAAVTGSVAARGDRGVVELSNLPRLPRGEVYKVWLQRNGRMVGDRAFTPDPDGHASVDLRGGVQGVTKVAITHETDPGVAAPTSAPIVTASLA